jgi:hypothetical protein
MKRKKEQKIINGIESSHYFKENDKESSRENKKHSFTMKTDQVISGIYSLTGMTPTVVIPSVIYE